MKKMSNAFMILVGAGFLTLLACSPAAHIEKDKFTDFSKYKTYAWIDSDQEQSKQGKVNSLAEQNIRNAVNKELAKEGWREVRNRPDVLIGYDVLVERTTKEMSNPVYSTPFTRPFYNPYTRRWGTIYYPSQFLGYDRDRYNTKEGTITISIIDVQTDKMVWQGWSKEEVNSSNLTRKEIESGVKSIFRKFDVAKN
jgi:hypothetical protein